MIGLLLAIISFNVLAFVSNKKLTGNQIVHVWSFTIAFQMIFDTIVEFKYHGYWYFDKEVDWLGLLPHTVLIPPVNMIFLNRYPHKGTFIKQLFFFTMFVIAILMYEVITLLPDPWGYFHYGWWKIWHAVIADPILLLIILLYYKWICSLEKKAAQAYKP